MKCKLGENFHIVNICTYIVQLLNVENLAKMSKINSVTFLIKLHE